MAIQYLNPTAETVTPQEAYLPRLGDLATPRLALFPNLFADSREFLLDLAKPLARLSPQASFPYFDKQFGRYMSTPATQELRTEIKAASDAVILAYGHCGSCTSGVVHDGVLLAREGKPVCVLVTARFRDEALFLAKALGLPDMPFVFLPHPVAGRTADWHQELADKIADDVMRALKTGASFDHTRAMDARALVSA